MIQILNIEHTSHWRVRERVRCWRGNRRGEGNGVGGGEGGREGGEGGGGRGGRRGEGVRKIVSILFKILR